MLAADDHVFVAGSYSFVLLERDGRYVPPTRTLPLASRLAMLALRRMLMLAVGDHVSVAGSYSSVLAEEQQLPVTKTFPLGSSVAV